MRVSVTGASGFLGSFLTAAIEREMPGAVVTTISRRDPLPDSDVIFHLAGGAGIEASLADPLADLDANAKETLRRLEELRQADRQPCFILASSCAAYGAAQSPVSEDAPLIPRSPYGVSKAAAESAVGAYRSLAGIDGRIARIANPYGPGQRRLMVYDLARRALDESGALRVRGTGSETRDLIHAEDVGHALIAVATRGQDGGIYNVGSGVPSAIRDVATMIALAAGKRAEDVIFEGIGEPGKVDTFFPSIDRIRALGFEPRHPLAQGIGETVRWVGGQ